MVQVGRAAAVGVSAIALAAAFVYWNTRRPQRKKKWLTLKNLALNREWVSICGLVFQVDANVVGPDGIYGDIGGHDATVTFSGRLYSYAGANSAEDAIAASLDSDIDGPLTESERDQLKAWMLTFKSKYPVVGQLSDLYNEPRWDALRAELETATGATKCPLGFGTRRNVDFATKTAKMSDRWILFSGKRYDVSNSKSFDAESPFAMYVGHDITYALAIGSRDAHDLDISLTDAPPLTFAQQKTLAQYQHAFDSSLPVLD
ncbi:hypothetical protein LEN26_007611 [Aphanomyces euteiches]|nr:hypothetical protein AeMF1_009197 [Aphanomyces euteiches]KAH9131689.1 hypothetical protein LEN26_007611 [Aphanomyces euteiches]KAH9197107.1 hypothetical protein AeNC1_000916 [Aphanomyces euteiches]